MVLVGNQGCQQWEDPRSTYWVGGGIEDEETMAPLVRETKQKGKLTMDQMVESSWRLKEHSATGEETISPVGKTVEIPRTTSGGSYPKLLGLVRRT